MELVSLLILTLASSYCINYIKKVLKLSYQSYQLAFHYPFTIAKGTKTHQPTIILALENLGVKGYGEAPIISYYPYTLEKIIATIEAKKIFIEKFAFTTPERYWHYLHHLIPNNPFLICALDIAAWDMYGKMQNKSLRKLWNLDHAKSPKTSYTIGLDSIDKMVEKINKHPWPIYKIKLGTKEDIDIVKALRKHTKAVFRVDANAAWTAAQAIDIITALQFLGVELVEQPLAKDDWEGMQYLHQRSPIPLFADESCVNEHDVEQCTQHFHGINIKLTKCGGITPAKQMIVNAQQRNLKIMIGSMNESTIGTAAAAHLLPLVDYADIDGPLLLKEDLAKGLLYDSGYVSIASNPGLGIERL